MQPTQPNDVVKLCLPLRFAFWLMLFQLPLGTAWAAEADKLECVLLTREGKVEVARKGTTQWSVGQTNQALQVGDRLRTGFRSRATLQWSGLSVLRVDELTSMEIAPPEKAGDKPELQLRSGASYLFSREKPTEIQFRTPVASGAIRGTEFNLAVGEDGRTVLSLLDGAVDLANAQGTATLQSGEQGVVETGRAPVKSALINAINVIQWVLYYPAVVDPEDLGLTANEQQALTDSLKAYRSGDLLQALSSYPENRQPTTDADRAFHAALLLAVGQVDAAEADLRGLTAPSGTARALREVVVAVKHQTLPSLSIPGTASEWLARSYYFQSRSQLQEALDAAREAAKKSPGFGAASIRVAELEFGFGRSDVALTALDHGLESSPRNAGGLAVKGFVLSARNKFSEALGYFDQAIGIDGALGNAWLGRGLVKIRLGSSVEGMRDLEVAAALEPQRAVLRSYLGKAFSHTRDTYRAQKELRLARKLDPQDPTGWLYSALLNEQENRINEAVEDLQKSQDLNNNRSVFRSRLLLDQDQAVRGANLAAIYRDAGMTDVSVQEASRAVNYDYANYSAHLFLAESYDALRDPKLINLRYETPAFSELLVANLLAPPNASSLSQNISQQEYSRFFDSDHLGFFSDTEYSSRGNWIQNASQYGNLGNSSYSVDAFYRAENGQRPNNSLEQLELDVRFKQQITPKDGVFFQVSDFHAKAGDVAQYYDQASASQTLSVKEKQEPNLILGYHREWVPGSHTLVLAGRFDDTLTINDSDPALLFHQTFINPFTGTLTDRIFNPILFSLNYRSELVAYSAEVQQIWQSPVQTLVVGGRYQTGSSDTASDLSQFGSPVTSQRITTDLDRVSVYAYENWQIIEPLRLTVGGSYDRLHYPQNIDTSPISSAQATKDEFAPKAGLLYTPFKDTHLRAVYTRSLGGVFFDQSVRLEPVQIAGFNQAFRSLLPESVAGLVPGTRFETWGAGVDQAIKKTRTYFELEGQILKSKGSRLVGVLTNSDAVTDPAPDSPSGNQESLHYREQSLLFTANQLLGRDYSLGASYKLTHADLDSSFIDLAPSVVGASALNQDVSATLHQVYLYGNYYHPSGVFAQANAVWSKQSNHGYTPAEPGDDFWQYNLYVGYRFFQRRAEARLGLVNLSNRDYRLNPLTLYNELPRERMLVASLKFYF